jgi:hypothetical protein
MARMSSVFSFRLQVFGRFLKRLVSVQPCPETLVKTIFQLLELSKAIGMTTLDGLCERTQSIVRGQQVDFVQGQLHLAAIAGTHGVPGGQQRSGIAAGERRPWHRRNAVVLLKQLTQEVVRSERGSGNAGKCQPQAGGGNSTATNRSSRS